ncbi:unnamed protein product [Phytophthora fragariaefolia]|uniref:Unnamed protein product n=1 Tax=Phytophthora fragariaefolia TaxID=1490495 RepID=A0A9W6Y2F2_9STRA|nr:unnamed protein product [Phytophthora fragariaefolia]
MSKRMTLRIDIVGSTHNFHRRFFESPSPIAGQSTDPDTAYAIYEAFRYSATQVRIPPVTFLPSSTMAGQAASTSEGVSPTFTTATARTPPERVRVSPYPERVRTPVRNTVYEPASSDLYRLEVQPIVKTTITQRDASGHVLDNFVASGSSFQAILEKHWNQFSPRMKGRAVKTDGVWSTQPPSVDHWTKTMQFKVKRHVVDTARSDQSWKTWLHGLQGEPIKVFVYEYGTAIAKAEDRENFMNACIRPLSTNRAGAVAEASLREVVEQLHARWDDSFDGEAVIWVMWANEATCNLDRSTWDAAIAAPPPRRILNLLRASNTRMEEHLAGMRRSAHTALDCVNSALANYAVLRQDLRAFSLRLDSHEAGMAVRKASIEVSIRDMELPYQNDISNPTEHMENLRDFEHE